nr:MAG TPA: hypothetical protein [Caudoviricetes sp.]
MLRRILGGHSCGSALFVCVGNINFCGFLCLAFLRYKFLKAGGERVAWRMSGI